MIKTIAHLADIHIRKLHRFVEYRQVFKNLYKQLKDLKPVQDGESELLAAMKMISKTGNGPKEQFPSMGCSIKWFK